MLSFFLATQQLRRAKRQANKNKPDKIEKKMIPHPNPHQTPLF